MSRLSLHHVKSDLGPTETRIQADSVFENNFITGKQLCYEELEQVVRTIQEDLNNILKKGKKLYQQSN